MGRGQKRKYLPTSRREVAASGVRSDEPTPVRTRASERRAIKREGGYTIKGQRSSLRAAAFDPCSCSRARTPTKRSKQVARISTFLIDIRESLGKGLRIRPLKVMVNHHTTEGLRRRAIPG